MKQSPWLILIACTNEVVDKMIVLLFANYPYLALCGITCKSFPEAY